LIEDDFAGAMSLQVELIAEGYTVRLERKAKNVKAQLEELAASGYEFFAYQADTRQELEIRSLS